MEVGSWPRAHRSPIVVTNSVSVMDTSMPLADGCRSESQNSCAAASSATISERMMRHLLIGSVQRPRARMP